MLACYIGDMDPSKLPEIQKYPYFFLRQRKSILFAGDVPEKIQGLWKSIFGLRFREIFDAHPSIHPNTFPGHTDLHLGSFPIVPQSLTIIAGPCSIDSFSLVDETAHFLSELGIPVLRGGTFKGRTSPYTFQGCREDAVQWLAEAGKKYSMQTITEVVSEETLASIAPNIDILQIGSRNAQNYELLKKVGQSQKTVLLKRGFMNSLEEFLFCAEYVALQGNDKIILCERGIRTFETATRNTFDVASVPILQKETYLPVFVDPSHAAGRTDIIPALVKASIAVGALGIMLEVHPDPWQSQSDPKQTLNFFEFRTIFQEIVDFCQKLDIRLNVSKDISA